MGPSTVIGEIPVEGGPLKTAGMPGFRIWNWTATNFLSSRELCLARHFLILRLAAKNGNTLTENLSCTYCRHLMVLATARCSVEATTLQLFIILDTASYRRVPNSHRNSSSQQHLVRTLAKLEWTADCFAQFPQLQMALNGTARSYRCRHFCNRFVVPRDYKFSPRLPVSNRDGLMRENAPYRLRGSARWKKQQQTNKKRAGITRNHERGVHECRRLEAPGHGVSEKRPLLQLKFSKTHVSVHLWLAGLVYEVAQKRMQARQLRERAKRKKAPCFGITSKGQHCQEIEQNFVTIFYPIQLSSNSLDILTEEAQTFTWLSRAVR